MVQPVTFLSAVLKYEKFAQIIVLIDLVWNPVLSIFYIYPLAETHELGETKFYICEAASLFIWLLLAKSVYSSYRECGFFNVRNQIDLWRHSVGAHTLFFLYLSVVLGTIWIPFVLMCLYRVCCYLEMEKFRGEVEREKRKLFCLFGQRRFISDNYRMMPDEKWLFPQRIR